MLFPFDAYCITSSSVLWCSFFFFSSSSALPAFTVLLRFLSLLFSLPLWCPLSLTHFTLASSLFIWLCHLLCHLRPLLQTPSPISPGPADSAAGFWARTSLCVRWEQVTPQGARWPHCVTFTPAHIKFVWDAASLLEAPFKLVWATWRKQRDLARGRKYSGSQHCKVYYLA